MRDFLQLQTRRRFLRDCGVGLAGIWLAQSLGSKLANAIETIDPANPLAPRSPTLPAKAKRVIYLHMAGGPSQFELFDHKPELAKLDGQDCPDEFLAGKRFAFIRGVPAVAGPDVSTASNGRRRALDFRSAATSRENYRQALFRFTRCRLSNSTMPRRS